jgi:hypothetical protein
MDKIKDLVSHYALKLVVLGLVIFLGFLCWDSREARFRSELRDLQLQLAHSVQKSDTFYIRDSIPVYRERIVEVDRTDYKRQLADRELIDALELKLSQVESENRTLLATRDTVVLDSLNDSILTYRDKWLSFVYATKTRVLGCEVRDSLTTYVTREYKHRFLWWRWGTKGYNVYTVSHNPNCRVEYNKYIKVED